MARRDFTATLDVAETVHGGNHLAVRSFQILTVAHNSHSSVHVAHLLFVPKPLPCTQVIVDFHCKLRGENWHYFKASFCR